MSVFPCHQKIIKVEGCDCECHDIEDTRVLQGAEEGSNQCQESLTELDLPFQATCCYNERKGGALAYELSKERHYVGPGRPLGFHVAGEWLYVCCSLKGLLRLHLGSGAIELLSGATGSPPSPLA